MSVKKGRNPLCRSRVCVKKIMHMQIEKKKAATSIYVEITYEKRICETWKHMRNICD